MTKILRRHAYSRDKLPDCPQVVIAFITTRPAIHERRRSGLKWPVTVRPWLRPIAR
ncbi:MAG: hypothetical protein ABI024_01390 [Vicinamibacterales bacterium]